MATPPGDLRDSRDSRVPVSVRRRARGSASSLRWRGALHIFGLSGFAFAQPLFDALREHPTFFIAHGSDGRAVVAFAVALVLAPAFLLVTFVTVARMVAHRAGTVLQAIVVGALVGVAVMGYVSSLRTSAIVPIAAFLVISSATAIAYHRLGVIQRYATALSFAPLVLLALFLTSAPIRALISVPPAPDVVSSQSQTPVVMLLTDEFSQGSILRPDGEIDAARFPSFGRLAESSTWYPNATTNTSATHVALPSIMTGRFPSPSAPPPTHASYPRNLFSLLAPSHEINAEEWVTALCPVQTCRTRTFVYDSKHLVADTTLVYLHVVLPRSMRAALPDLGHQWAGFFANPAENDVRIMKFPRFLRTAVRAVTDRLEDDDLRSYQVHRFRRFVASIRRDTPTPFSFIHVGLPHQPWHLMPDARAYNRWDSPGLSGPTLRWADDRFADAGLQRYLLQVKATDRLLGELIDSLQHEGLWDRALVVVMADHGVAFEERTALRSVLDSPDAVLPIPLFIKYPEQHAGAVDEKNAELVDVLPTIADVLDVKLPWRVDGASLAGDAPGRPVKRVWAIGRALPPYDLEVTRHKTKVSGRISRLFGDARKRGDLFAFGPHRRLYGKEYGSVTTEERDGFAARFDEAWRWRSYREGDPYVPARASGTIRTEDAPPWIGVVLNGRVAGFGRPWRARDGWRFDVLVSDAYLEPGRNDLGLIGIDEREVFEIPS